MRRRGLITMLTILIVIFYFSDFVFSKQQNAEESELASKIIVLRTFDKPLPTILESKPGTTVIWVNHSQRPQEILFIGKKVVSACSSPVNFFIGKGAAYESNEIPFGGSASLCFMSKGMYQYRFKPSITFYPEEEVEEYHAIVWIK